MCFANIKTNGTTRTYLYNSEGEIKERLPLNKKEREKRNNSLFGGDCERIHYCSSECPETKWFPEETYQLKEAQRKIALKKIKK